MVNAGGPAAQLPQSDVDAGQLLGRLLQLIEGSSSIDQITAGRVSDILRVPVQHSTERDFGYGARLTPEWMYRVDFRGNPNLGPVLAFRIFNNEGTDEGSLTDVSQLDFEQFATALQAQGFAENVRYGEHGRRLGSSFTRDGLAVEVVVNGESEDNPTHLCIQTVQVR